MPTRRDLLKSAAAAAAVGVAPRAARAQARKPVLTIGFPSTPETIDPHQLRSVLSGSIIGLMGEGLVTRDPQTMEIKPVLAESWKNLNPNTPTGEDEIPPPTRIYGGVRQDWTELKALEFGDVACINLIFAPFYLADLPLSLIGDTLTLPYTAGVELTRSIEEYYFPKSPPKLELP